MISKSVMTVLLLLLVAGCSSDPGPAPVRELVVGEGYQQYQYGAYQEQTYKVEEGQTLYSIAWYTGMDFRTLARINNIPEPYIIFPGQVLNLKQKVIDKKQENVTARRGNSVASVPVFQETKVKPLKKVEIPQKVSPPAKTSSSGKNISSTAKKPNKTSTASGSQSQNSLAKARSKAVDRAKQKGYVQKATTVKRSSAKASHRKSFPKKVRHWVWPGDGVVLSRFSLQQQGYKGIDIGGKYGQEVKAAAAGKVVYAGSGLRGYGQLVIIKHSEEYLSAYAHNSRILVKEGEWVQIGQQIAEMGNSGSDRVKLHFEIRYRGQPVDPQRFLPSR